MEQKLEDLSSRISQLTLLEAAELVKILEERLGVSASPQVLAMASPAATSAGQEVVEEEEKTEFDVILISGGSNKVAIIKEIRAITNLPLKEAKDAAEGTNVLIKSGISKKDAEAIKKQLEAIGAEVKVV